jgi:hypothetical protein
MHVIPLTCFYKLCRSIAKRRVRLDILSPIFISIVALAAPLRAEFAYVANFNSNTVSAYRTVKPGL